MINWNDKQKSLKSKRGSTSIGTLDSDGKHYLERSRIIHAVATTVETTSLLKHNSRFSKMSDHLLEIRRELYNLNAIQ